MSLNQIVRRRSRRLTVGVVAGLVLAAITVGSPADAAPTGSLGTVQIEIGDPSGSPAGAVTSGWWGHEGGLNDGTGTGSTSPSFDISDDGTPPVVDQATIDAAMAKLGASSPSDIGYAIVPFSANGSNERPLVTAGEDAASAFANQATGTTGGILYAGYGTTFNGSSNANDGVTLVSTYTQVKGWVDAGEPLQGFDNSLVLHDALAPGNPVSLKPQGTSILKAWPAGTELSLVAYVTDGQNTALQNAVPNVKVGADGHALTAWLPFTTVAKPSDASRSSAGYQVVGAYAPTLTVTHTFTGSTANLKATVTNNASAVALDATGTMQFSQFSGGTDTPVGSPVAVTNGVATLPVPGFTSGVSKTYHATYLPDGAAQGTYLTSMSLAHTVTAPIATTTSLTITGSTSHTFTAKVSPAAPGSVTFKNGSSVLGSATVSGGSAHIVKSLSAGKHVIQAIFNPSSSTYASSSATRTVYQATVTATLKPTHGRRGTRPVVTVRVVASGTTPGGKVVIVFDPPTGPTKRFTVTLSHGVATFKLPRTVRGSTRVTALYGGSGAVLAANSKTVIFKAT